MKKLVGLFLALVLVFTVSIAFAAGGFKDVKPGSWYYPFVTKASEMGIISGYADGTFRPSDSVTRAQASKMFSLYDAQIQKTVVDAIKANSAEEQKVITAIAKAAPLVVEVYTDNGAGSGFFVKPDVVMTNAHVLDGVAYVDVVTSSGEKLQGTLIKADIYKDIALIKVPKKSNVVTFSTSLTVGQNAIAIGHPLSMKYSVTKGIVSKLDVKDFKASNMFQFDAPVNSGNSGGVVINSSGQVIGMTTGEMVGDGVDGMSYAIRAQDLLNYMK